MIFLENVLQVLKNSRVPAIEDGAGKCFPIVQASICNPGAKQNV